jgi:cytochrome c biogenesis protein ResB
MNSLRAKLRLFPFIQLGASVKIAVVCLGLLFVLTFWGTVAQVENGLYNAQERYFYSLVFPVFGFLPFPGARLILWVLFVNLVCATIVHFQYRWRSIGILIIHFGLLSFFVAAFVTYHSTEESQLTLMEGAAANVSLAYQDWELSVWKEGGATKEVMAYDTKHLKPGQILEFPSEGFALEVKLYHPNAEAYTTTADFHANVVVNSSGIRILKPILPDIEPQKNMPGAIFHLQGQDVNILLYGGEIGPTPMNINGKTYNFMLRHKHYHLPFMVKLNEFTMERHPNTEVARIYQSQVEVISGETSRPVLISMNEPLRHKDYTFYQASYAIDSMGRELSTLAVVKNSGRLLPYIATGITTIGLIVHFLMMGLGSRKRRKPDARSV